MSLKYRNPHVNRLNFLLGHNYNIQLAVNYWNSSPLRRHLTNWKNSSIIYTEVDNVTLEMRNTADILYNLFEGKLFNKSNSYSHSLYNTKITIEDFYDSVDNYTLALDIKYEPRNKSYLNLSIRDFVYNKFTDRSYFVQYLGSPPKLLPIIDSNMFELLKYIKFYYCRYFLRTDDMSILSPKNDKHFDSIASNLFNHCLKHPTLSKWEYSRIADSYIKTIHKLREDGKYNWCTNFGIHTLKCDRFIEDWIVYINE